MTLFPCPEAVNIVGFDVGGSKIACDPESISEGSHFLYNQEVGYGVRPSSWCLPTGRRQGARDGPISLSVSQLHSPDEVLTGSGDAEGEKALVIEI